MRKRVFGSIFLTSLVTLLLTTGLLLLAVHAGLTTVSYTHLDVYKRQRYHHPRREKAARHRAELQPAVSADRRAQSGVPRSRAVL